MLFNLTETIRNFHKSRKFWVFTLSCLVIFLVLSIFLPYFTYYTPINLLTDFFLYDHDPCFVPSPPSPPPPKNFNASLYTGDCNYVNCEELPKPKIFLPVDGMFAESLNAINQIEYEMLQKMCRRFSEKVKRSNLDQSKINISSLKPQKIHMENVESFFYRSHLNMDVKCDYPCTRTGHLEEADIYVFSEVPEIDYKDCRYAHPPLAKDSQKLNKYLADIRNQGKHPKIAILGSENCVGNIAWIYESDPDYIDYYLFHIPFSDIPGGYAPPSAWRSYFCRLANKYNNGVQTYIPYDPKTYPKYFSESYKNKVRTALASNFMYNCGTQPYSGIRQKYLAEIKQHIKVHEFGKRCENPQKTSDFVPEEKFDYAFKVTRNPGFWRFGGLKEHDSGDMYRNYLEKVLVMQRYKFTFCFENGISYGYATEKLIHAMLAQYTIPVYMGSPNIIKMWFGDIPERYRNKIIIFANDYPDPKKLADYLKFLDENEGEYRKYFQWRFDGYVWNIPKRMGNWFWNKIDDSKLLDSSNNMNWFCRLCKFHFLGKRFCHFKNYRKDEFVEGFQ